MPTIKGTAVAPGLAIGVLHVVRARPDAVPTWSISAAEVAAEISRLESAVSEARERLDKQRQLAVEAAASERDAGIFDVHLMILQDPSALEAIQTTIREQRINAESSIQSLIERLKATMGRLEGDSVRGYAADVSEPWQIVLSALLQHEDEQISAAQERVVLAATELTPQVVTYLERNRVLAVISETGGRFSHGAVLARSFGIPCVVGLPNLLVRLEQGMQVAVDGDRGTVELRPDEAAIDAFLRRRQRRVARQDALEIHAELPAVTKDGSTMRIGVNMESVRDISVFPTAHCDEVGLLRTEFLYMERSEFPSEEEQFRLYRRVLEHMADKPVTLRTLDIGGDKPLPYFKTPPERNPALGWRGLRITLEWQDLMRVQLRAALRASAYGNLRLLLPMVTSLEEVIAVHEIFDGVKAQLLDQGYEVAEDLPVGVMVEVPSSIWILDQIAPIVDFISVGTNDLIQYLLAVDRDNPFVAKLYDPQHPAVIRALKQIADVTTAAGKSCGVCGELAGDFGMAVMLLGMGYRSLSMSPFFLAEVRFAIRETSEAEAREVARQALEASSSNQVREILAQVRDRLHTGLMRSRQGTSKPAQP